MTEGDEGHAPMRANMRAFYRLALDEAAGCGIYFVATKPANRGRGLFATDMWERRRDGMH